MRNLLPVTAVIFCLCSVAAAADLTQEAGHVGLKYVNEMLTTCNGRRYVKSAQMEEIREYKGDISVSLHEPPMKDAARGIKWTGGFEIVCAHDRMYLKGEGWTDDPPQPLLFSVRQEHDQWKTSGLRKITCSKIPDRGVK